MNSRLLLLILLILSLFLPTHPVVVDKSVETNPHPEKIAAKQMDKQAKILAAYLASHDSPLKYHAQDLIDAAREYGLDWKLVAAISGVESTFGKNIPGGYNAWGWGAYDEYHAVYFDSWKEGIYTVSKGLRENYLDKGLTDPYLINRAYASSPYWGGKVTYFMNDIDQFAQKYDLKNQPLADVVVPSMRIAAISGQLAFR